MGRRKKWVELNWDELYRYEAVRESLYRQTQDGETATIAACFAVGLDPEEVL